MGFAGVIAINLNGDKIGSGFTFMGEGMVLLAAASFGAGALISKKIAQDVILITVYNFLIPIFGVILSAAFLGESIFEIRIIAALLFVCGGIYIINKPQIVSEAP